MVMSHALSNRARALLPVLIPLSWGAAIFVAAAFLRFHRITEEGVTEEDSVGYYRIALLWLDGEYNLWWEQFYRPVVYALDALALRVFGINDYAIKVFSGVCDLGTVALVIYVGKQLTGKYLPGLLAAQLYAVVPFVVRYARTAMPHALSTFCVAAAVAAFCVDRSRGLALSLRLLRDGVAGALLAVAAHTHAELALLGPGFFAAQCCEELPAPRRWGVRLGRLYCRGLVLSIGFAIPCVGGVLFFGFDRVKSVFETEFGQTTFTPAYVESTPLYQAPARIFTVSSETLYGHAWLFPAFILMPFLAWAVVKYRHGKTAHLAGLAPLVLLAMYALLFPFTIGAFDATYIRIILPILPLVYLTFACGAWQLVGELRPPTRGAAFAACAVALFATTSNGLFNPYFFRKSAEFRTSRFRSVYDEIGDRVTPERRLLIVPAFANSNVGYQLPFYFGENAVFLSALYRPEKYTPGLLASTIFEERFAYIFESNSIDPVFAVAGWPRTPDQFRWYHGMSMEGYSLETEKRIIKEGLNDTGAHVLKQLEWGTIYSRQKRPMFPNSDFSLGSLEHWHVRGFAPMFTLDRLPPRDYETSRILRTPGRICGPATLTKPPAETRYSVNTCTDERTGHTAARQHGRAALVGELVSDEFYIEEPVIGFEVGGVGDMINVNVALRVDDVEFRSSAAGTHLMRAQWNVAEHIGKRAQIIVRDTDARQDHGIAVAGFYYVF